MSKLLEELSSEIKDAGEYIRQGYTSINYGSVVKMLNRLQGCALEHEAEKESYKALLETVIKYSNAEDIIKKQCKDVLDRFNN